MSQEVLVLNSDYEPLNVCNARRAIVLVYLGKAEILHAEDDALTVPSHSGWHLRVEERGRLDAFAIVRSEDEREALEPDEVRVQVRAAGVNFRDVLNALDVVPAPRLGLECAGIVREVGAGVVYVRPGDRVMGMAMGTFGDEARMDASRLVRIPDALTFAEAATIPVAFITALYALDDLAALAPGERVLVHAAAGGVGMAAVRLAREVVDGAGEEAPSALASAGHALAFFAKDYESGNAAAERALLLAPNSALVLWAAGWLRVYLGDAPAAVAHLERAMRLSPVDPAKFYVVTALGFANFLLRRYGEAAELGRRALGDRPNFLPAHRLLVASLAQLGDRAATEAARRSLLAVAPGYTVSIALSHTAMRDPVLFKALRKAGLPE